ncbi:NAD/NADP dependent alcohol dehydrogenase, partial [Halocaridina rubra]
VIKCRAAVAWEANKPMTIEEIEVAPPKAKEIRVKIVATGVCHSDLSALKGILPFVRFPTVLGHEASGIVESVGSEVTSVKEGDHILTSFLPQCKDCHFCKSPGTNLCMKFMKEPHEIGFMFDGTNRMSCKGKELHQFIGSSSYSEYTVLDDHHFNKVNKVAPLDKICILSCGVTTGYGGPIKTAKVTPGSTCAVFGLGTVGLGAVMGCKNSGAAKIIGVDINNDKKEISKKFGVTDFCNPNDSDKPIHEVLKEMTQGGCDYTFECIGNSAVIESALEATRVGTGQCVVIGVTPFGQKFSVDPYQLLFGRVLTGCFLGGFAMEEVPGLVEDYMTKKVMVDEFITSTMPIEEVNKAFDILRQGKTLKTVLKF